jgi:ubiquinone/menaquinone biosynthesis C-methylase UbiE
MKSTFNLVKLASKAILLKQTANINLREDSILKNDDDTYSQYFENTIEKMLEKLPITPGEYILDLVCGSGEFTHRLAKKVEYGKVVAVDISSRIASCKLSLDFSNISFVKSDVFSFLSKIPKDTIDGIVCPWGISQLNHHKFIEEIRRVLKPGGFVGIIEDRSDSLKDVSDIFLKVLIQYPDALIKNVIMNLPKNKDYLIKLLRKNFHIQDAWEGEVVIPCNNGYEVVEYLLKSADIGFADALDKKFLPQVMQAFVIHADKRFAEGWKYPVLHKYCAVIAIKN